MLESLTPETITALSVIEILCSIHEETLKMFGRSETLYDTVLSVFGSIIFIEKTYDNPIHENAKFEVMGLICRIPLGYAYWTLLTAHMLNMI